jgi:hypothetical protein
LGTGAHGKIRPGKDISESTLISRLIALVLLVPFSVLLVLAEIYPYRPATAGGWGVLAFLALPLVLAGEFFGDRVLGAPFVARCSRATRIIYGVIVLVAVIVCAAFALQLLDGQLVKWNS